MPRNKYPISNRLVVAVDVGGTTMKGALVNARARATHSEYRLTLKERGAEAVIESVLAFVTDLVGKCRELVGSASVAGIGLAVPGLVDEKGCTAVASSNIGWREVAFGELLTRRASVPVFLGHDVRLASLAEQLMGAARGCTDFLFVALGTGVGSAVVLEGKPYAGAHGTGGEFGHTTVDPAGPICACGRIGCLEAVASAGAIEKRYAELTGITRMSARQICERAAGGGDSSAVAVWNDAISFLGWAIADYISLLDPERIIIGGGLSEAGEYLLGPLKKATAERLRYTQFLPPIMLTALGKGAGCYGAALNAWLRLGVSREQLTTGHDPADRPDPGFGERRS